MQLTIGKRITLGFTAVIAITLGLAVFFFTRLNAIDGFAVEIAQIRMPSLALAGQMESTVRANYRSLLEYVHAENDKERGEVRNGIQALAQTIDQLAKEYQSKIITEEGRKLFADFEAARAAWRQARDQILAEADAGKTKEAIEATKGQAKAVFDRYRQSAAAMEDFSHKHGDLASEHITQAVSSGKTGAIIGSAAATLVAVGIAVVIALGISRTLNRVAGALGEGSEQVASAAGQVSASSQSLAQGASEQAASLEETSSSLEEMSSMTKKNAESAQQAAGLSADAKTSADKGNQAMQKMSSAINDIQKSAAATAKIIKVIDEIAFQTNLLALNAAVEAARAGEAGKGFAVVAEEVRNLAMRSAEAAKNTASMIEESVQNAKNGVAITTEVAGMLEEITASNTKVNSLVGEISAASQEQTTGIDQVNKAVSQMDKVTQSNAANAEESASASEELSAQAEQMKAIV
ncbi:MAG: methyl-accepting chemotaxis protein, partial [Tepidisphaerales bacterium]